MPPPLLPLVFLAVGRHTAGGQKGAVNTKEMWQQLPIKVKEKLQGSSTMDHYIHLPSWCFMTSRKFPVLSHLDVTMTKKTRA